MVTTDGLVIAQEGGNYILTVKQSIDWADRGLLWCTTPAGHRVSIDPIDADGDGYNDSVRSAPDGTKLNNLLSLRIYDRLRKVWMPATKVA